MRTLLFILFLSVQLQAQPSYLTNPDVAWAVETITVVHHRKLTPDDITAVLPIQQWYWNAKQCKMTFSLEAVKVYTDIKDEDDKFKFKRTLFVQQRK